MGSRRPVAPVLAKRRRTALARDPRFDDMSGQLDVDMFHKSYAFLDEYRDSELASIKKAVNTLRKKKGWRRTKNIEARREDLTLELRKRVQQDKQRRHFGELRSAELALKAEEREKVRTTG